MAENSFDNDDRARRAQSAGVAGIVETFRGTPSIVAANALTLILAIMFDWDVVELAILYWTHSVIIGALYARRMMKLRQFSTVGFNSNGRSVPETESGKRSTVRFFLAHYGFFHLIYCLFLFGGSDRGGLVAWLFLGMNLVMFGYHEWARHEDKVTRDYSRKPNIGTMMFMPYIRIVPMHLFILIGGVIGASSPGALFFFIGLKTLADVAFEKAENAVDDKVKQIPPSSKHAPSTKV